MSTDEPDTDTDDLAEAFPHVAELEQELKEADIDVGDIDVGEILQQRGTTRRDLLAGGAGVLGLGGLLTAASGTASAGNDQAGAVGSQAAPLDGYVEDLYDKNGNRVAELPGDGSLDVLQAFSAPSANIDEAQIAARVDNKAEERIWGVEATEPDFPGWISIARFDHGGSNNEVAAASVSGVVHHATLGDATVDVDARDAIASGISWGTAGNTISIATDARFKIDDNDSSILYLQVNIDDEPVVGVLWASVAAGFGSSATVLDVPALTDSS